VITLISLAAWTFYYRGNQQKIEATQDGHCSKYLFVMLLLYPIVTQKTVQIFSCREIGDEYYLQSDVTLICYDELWTTYAYLAAGAVVVYALGIPVTFWILLYSNRDNLEQTRTAARYGILYEGYTAAFFGGELIDMLRKFMLSAMILFIMPGSVMQICAALAISGLFLLVHLKYQPYEDPSDNKMQTCGLLGLFVTVFAGLILMAAGCDATTEAEIAQRALTEIFFKVFMLAANTMVFGLMAYVTVFDVLLVQLMQVLLLLRLSRMAMLQLMSKAAAVKKGMADKVVRMEARKEKKEGSRRLSPEEKLTMDREWRAKYGFEQPCDEADDEAELGGDEEPDDISYTGEDESAGYAAAQHAGDLREAFFDEITDEVLNYYAPGGELPCSYAARLGAIWLRGLRGEVNHQDALSGDGVVVERPTLRLWLVATLGAFEETVALQALDGFTLSQAENAHKSLCSQVWTQQLYSMYAGNGSTGQGRGIRPQDYARIVTTATGRAPDSIPCELRARRAKRGGYDGDRSLISCTEADLSEWMAEEFSEEGQLVQGMIAVMTDTVGTKWDPAWAGEFYAAREALGLDKKRGPRVTINAVVSGGLCGQEDFPFKDHELVEVPDEQDFPFDEDTFEKYFSRYDFDGDGDINTADEMSCLTSNLINVYRIHVTLDHLDKVLEGPCAELSENEEASWTKDEYRAWFGSTFR